MVKQSFLNLDKRRRLHGRRGLKFSAFADDAIVIKVAAFTGGVD